MNKQEVFTKVAKHLLTQRAVSLLPGTHTCAYRGKDGRMCAIGCLIPDSKYNSRLEGKTMCSRDVQTMLPFAARSLPDVHFLVELQRIHDDYPVSEWEQRLKDFADGFKLNYEL